LAVVIAVVLVLSLVRAAWASYPGAAGTLAVQRSSEYTIENDNGVISLNFFLALQPPAGGPLRTSLSCQALDGNFGGQGDQYCPLPAADGSAPRVIMLPLADAEQPAFLPDGRQLIFAGAARDGIPDDLYMVSLTTLSAGSLGSRCREARERGDRGAAMRPRHRRRQMPATVDLIEMAARRGVCEMMATGE
jgi:hypothetical protein